MSIAHASRFTEGAITPTLLRFALPLLATNFLHSLAGTWGAIWVGQTLGANALTAVATASVILYMMMGAAMGIGTAAGVAIGQSLGAGDVPAVKRVVGSALAFVNYRWGRWRERRLMLAEIAAPPDEVHVGE